MGRVLGTRRLVAHPGGPHPELMIECAVARDGRMLRLEFVAIGAIGALALPPASAQERQDGLWQHTCFEAFVKPEADGEGYLEYNFAPSGAWAAYQFDGYRHGMRDLAVEGISVAASVAHADGVGRLSVSATVAMPDWPVATLHVGLSAVIEETDGTKSYWALAHPPGAPDFHHADCFALSLAPPEPA